MSELEHEPVTVNAAASQPRAALPSQRDVRQLRDQVLASYAATRAASERATQLAHEVNRLKHGLIHAENGHREAVAAMYAAMHQARSELAAMRASTLWRLMQPLRSIGRRSPGTARVAGRVAKLAWWVASLQVREKYKLWRERAMPVTVATVTEALPAPAGHEHIVPPDTILPLVLSDEPIVSIVISTYGQPAMTLGCLRSLAAAPPATPIEIILVDDAAPGTPELDALHLLAETSGVRLVRNPANLGFLRSCNMAAGLARGAYLHFLNNDTELWPGALDALVDVLETRPDAAMAGSKLIFPDGTLQEAGGILWEDASAWNYGRGQDRDRPEFNYVREADYCSGASILVRRSAFEQMGGFDEAFLPAYCEDTDLAFRLRAAGHKVLYAPRSVVVHHEGASHGTDLTQGGKAHQVVNMARFGERWRDVLQRDHYPNGTNLLRARDRAKSRTVILVIDHYPLRPDSDAGSRALLGLMQSLGDAGWVVKYWPENQAYDAVYTPMMEAVGFEVIDQRRAEDFVSWLQQEGAGLDHVLVARPETAANMIGPLLRLTNARLSFYGHDLHFERLRGEAKTTGDATLYKAAERIERLERRIWRLFDVVIYLSDDEAQRVREMEPGTNAVAVVPFCFDVMPMRTAPPPEQRLLFVAGFAHSPNVDAALFLVQEVLPLVEASIGPINLVLAGSNPTETVRALAGPRIKVTGFVTDAELAALYRDARVAIVPLRFGAGVKGKVVEALSNGLPLVTTPVGAQGIAELGSVASVCETAAEMASAVASLMRDSARWTVQSQAQTAFAATRFSRTAMRHSVLQALDPNQTSLHK